QKDISTYILATIAESSKVSLNNVCSQDIGLTNLSNNTSILAHYGYYNTNTSFAKNY
ncbi:17743_t:CDS:1, partial [Racocetra persica]